MLPPSAPPTGGRELPTCGEGNTDAPIDQPAIEEALSLPSRDLENAVQMIAALHCGAQYPITRNVQDYQAGPLPAPQPAEFLALIARSSGSPQ